MNICCGNVLKIEHVLSKTLYIKKNKKKCISLGVHLKANNLYFTYMRMNFTLIPWIINVWLMYERIFFLFFFLFLQWDKNLLTHAVSCLNHRWLHHHANRLVGENNSNWLRCDLCCRLVAHTRLKIPQRDLIVAWLEVQLICQKNLPLHVSISVHPGAIIRFYCWSVAGWG